MLVERITVFEGKLQVAFKSGVDIGVEIYKVKDIKIMGYNNNIWQKNVLVYNYYTTLR